MARTRSQGSHIPWLAADPGPRLGTLKTRRVLPHVLRQDEMAAMLTGLDTATQQAGPPAQAAKRRPTNSGRQISAAQKLRRAPSSPGST